VCSAQKQIAHSTTTDDDQITNLVSLPREWQPTARLTPARMLAYSATFRISFVGLPSAYHNRAADLLISAVPHSVFDTICGQFAGRKWAISRNLPTSSRDENSVSATPQTEIRERARAVRQNGRGPVASNDTGLSRPHPNPVTKRLTPPTATIGAAGAAPAHSGRALFLR
jgi:hypothetical protein